LIDVFFHAQSGPDALVAAAQQLKSSSSTGADLVRALSDAGFGPQHVQAAGTLTVQDELAAVLVQAGLLSAQGDAVVTVQTPDHDPQLHLSLKQLADLGVDEVSLSGHATVDLGLQSLTRDELAQLLTTLQGQRADASQPLFAGEGATLVMDNALMSDLLQGQSAGDAVVNTILQSLKDLGVNQMDGATWTPGAVSGALSATQTAVLVSNLSGVQAQLLGPDPQDLSQLLDHDLLAKPLT
jgi:hypothetical protein